MLSRDRARFPSRRQWLAGAGLALASPMVARANTPRRWRCVTSWAKNLLGPGVSAARLVRRIEAMSDGQLQIELFAAGEIVPALGVFDAVSTGTVEMGHSASLFWQGKLPVAPLFTTLPFGLTPAAHAAWLDAEGQALWSKAYAPFRVRPMLGGNTGPSSAGWFRKAIQDPADLEGLRIRVTGLGGELYRRLGATPIVLAPGETYSALERGLVDAAEFLAPSNDMALGLHRVARHLVFPGFNKPNGASELLVGEAAWQSLTPSLRAIIEGAARAEHDQGLAEAQMANARVLRQLAEQGVQFHRLPDAVLSRASAVATELVTDLAKTDPLSAEIVASYRSHLNDSARAWDRMSRL